jgi:hypothetical protein
MKETIEISRGVVIDYVTLEISRIGECICQSRIFFYGSPAGFTLRVVRFFMDFTLVFS